jgi:PKHD-type hydroxylase
MTHLPIWSIDKISTELCDLAINEFTNILPKDGVMGFDGSEFSHKTRNTTVRFAEHNHWFGLIMRGFGQQANKDCKWDFDITEHEAVQYAHYSVGQHYDWHVDNFPLQGLDLDRKITVVCLLSELTEFSAGELQIRLYSDYSAPLVKGSVIAFPSILQHRVTPVTFGLRKTATMWLSGPKFR